MKKLEKRSMAVLLAAVMAVGTMAGCSAKETEDSMAAVKEVKEEMPAPGSRIIRIAHTYDPNSESGKGPHEWIAAGIEKFERENPEYKVEEEYYGMNEIDNKLMSDYKAGISHDLVTVNTAQFAEQMASGGLKDLSSCFESLSKEEQDDFTWLKDWDSYQDTEGKLRGIPYTLHTRVIAYNKDMFKAAGLDPEKPPKTMEELVDYAQKLTTDEVWGYGTFIGSGRATAEIAFSPYFWYYGGDLLDENGNASFASEAGVQATQFLYDLIYKYKVTPEWSVSGDYFTTIRDPFLNGQYAMCDGVGNFIFDELERAGMISGAATPSREAKANNIGFFIAPENSSRYVNGWAFSIAESCEDPEAAFKLMMCLYDPDIYKIGVGGFPVRKSMYDQDIYQGEFWDIWKESLAVGRGLAPKSTTALQLCDAIAAAVQDCIIGKEPIRETLERYQEEYNNQYGAQGK